MRSLPVRAGPAPSCGWTVTTAVNIEAHRAPSAPGVSGALYPERTDGMKRMLDKVVGGSMRTVLRLARDRRGGTAIEALIMLPVIFAALGFGALLWETISVRRSMHTGTYLATRFLSLYPPRSTAPADWESVARMFVYKELKNSGFAASYLFGSVECEGAECEITE